MNKAKLNMILIIGGCLLLNVIIAGFYVYPQWDAYVTTRDQAESSHHRVVMLRERYTDEQVPPDQLQAVLRQVPTKDLGSQLIYSMVVLAEKSKLSIVNLAQPVDGDGGQGSQERSSSSQAVTKKYQLTLEGSIVQLLQFITDMQHANRLYELVDLNITKGNGAADGQHQLLLNFNAFVAPQFAETLAPETNVKQDDAAAPQDSNAVDIFMKKYPNFRLR